MAPFLGSPAHICGALFACNPSEYIRSRQRSRFANGNGAAPPPFVVDDFVKALTTAFLPKDLAARNGKLIYSIRQGPAQPLALFSGDYNALCTRAGPYAPTGQLFELGGELYQTLTVAGGSKRARAGAQGVVVAQEEGEGLSWTLPDAIDELSIAGGEILREEGSCQCLHKVVDDEGWRCGAVPIRKPRALPGANVFRTF
ncbi:hypothetical protein E4U35_004614 [Claviceps purpurea]|nr:hypothetical protein E4U35_004614 [Claviceps purpurea]